MELDKQVDFIAMTFLLGASRAIYTTGSKSQMEEFLADHLRDHRLGYTSPVVLGVVVAHVPFFNPVFGMMFVFGNSTFGTSLARLLRRSSRVFLLEKHNRQDGTMISSSFCLSSLRHLPMRCAAGLSLQRQLETSLTSFLSGLFYRPSIRPRRARTLISSFSAKQPKRARTVASSNTSRWSCRPRKFNAFQVQILEIPLAKEPLVLRTTTFCKDGSNGRCI